MKGEIDITSSWPVQTLPDLQYGTGEHEWEDPDLLDQRVEEMVFKQQRASS
jgi:hypothetical protein